MDDAFGVGGWVDERYETVDSALLFAASGFIFMEGSELNADEMEAFIASHLSEINAYLNAGGVIFFNSAPNEGDGMGLPDGVGQAILLDLEGTEQQRFELPGWVAAAGFSADGERIVLGSRMGAVGIWERDGRGGPILEQQGDVRSASFSPDGRYLLTASVDQGARLWRPTGDLVASLDHPGHVLSACFSGDGCHVATTGVVVTPIDDGPAMEEGTARLWSFDAEAGTVELTAELEGHTGQVSLAAFSPRGDRILTTSSATIWPDPAHGEEAARLWDTKGRLVAVLKGRERWLQWAGFFPDGERVLGFFTNGDVQVWDADGNQLDPGQNASGSVAWFPGFSGDGSRFAFGCVDGSAWLFDDSARVVAALAGHDAEVFAARISPDGDTVVTASIDGSLRIWDPTVLPEFHGHGAVVYGAAFSPAGDRVVTASEDRTARIWDARGATLAILEGHTSYVRTAVFSPDGQRVLTASRDASARLWDLAGNQLLVLAHRVDTGAACFSPSGEEIATVCRNGDVAIWNLAGRRLAEFDLDVWPVGVSFAPDGETLLLAASRTALLVSRSGEILGSFVHEKNVTSAVFSPDGRRVLTASADTTARLWAVGAEEEPLQVFRGHRAGLHQAAFSPDGQRIVTACEDDSIRIWDLDGALLSELRAQAGLHSAVFTPDGRSVLASSWTGSVRTWLIDPDEVVELAERRAAHREFTADERQTYAELLGHQNGED